MPGRGAVGRAGSRVRCGRGRRAERTDSGASTSNVNPLAAGRPAALFVLKGSTRPYNESA